LVEANNRQDIQKFTNNDAGHYEKHRNFQKSEEVRSAEGAEKFIR